MRNLASIQKVEDIQPIPGADAIEVASILGWKVVVKKGEFKAGNLCIYCEIDSVLPSRPEFEFLAKKKYRIKTIKLRGQISQGIAFPLSIVPPGPGDEEGRQIWWKDKIGLDVTEALGIIKYEVSEIQESNAVSNKLRLWKKKTSKSFPGYVEKTDETRLQSIKGILEEIKDIPMYVSLKIDGTSGTFAHKDGRIDVCSRTVSRLDPDKLSLWERVRSLYVWLKHKKSIPRSCVYWNIAKKYNIIEILKKTGNIAIQGEIAGTDIQGNKLNLTSKELFVFNVYDIDKREYYSYQELRKFCQDNDLPTVPILEVGRCFNDWDIDMFLSFAKGNYHKLQPREGIVVRPMVEQYSKVLRGRMSFKVINNDFLLKEK